MRNWHWHYRMFIAWGDGYERDGYLVTNDA
jgi:hypothetical protein